METTTIVYWSCIGIMERTCKLPMYSGATPYNIPSQAYSDSIGGIAVARCLSDEQHGFSVANS